MMSDYAGLSFGSFCFEEYLRKRKEAPWDELIEFLNSSGKSRMGPRAFSLFSGLRRDILYELLLSVEADQKLRFDPERLKMLEKKYGTCSRGHIYVVTESLARSERELDRVAELLEAAKNDVAKTVLPIFYGVNPSDVRDQTGSFAQAFADHEKKYKEDPQKVKRWRAALTELGNLAGWVSKGWHETKLIQEVVNKIRGKLDPPSSKPAIKNLPSTPSWSSSDRQKHDVFLNFRGADTRLAFVGHLHAALIQCKISTFRDDVDLEKGEPICEQLDKAIEGSRVWVVIVSPDYASSKWCLNELLKILECRKASKVGRKNETLMKPSSEYEEHARTLVNGDKTHKGKASLRNKENITNHNKREMGEFGLGVTYGGKWVDSVYIGGRTEEIVVSEDITYSELLVQLYYIVGVPPTENEIKISTIDESKSPAYPVEIINDDDLKNFIDQSLSSDVHLKHPLQNSSRRMESSHSGTLHLRRFGTYPSCVHCVTPDQVPHLHTQVGPLSPNVPCMQHQQQQPFYQQQQQQQPFHRQPHSYQQTTLQPFYEHYQPSFQQPQPLYQQLHPSYVQQQQPQYQQPNPSYMQPLSPIHHVPYSLKMF